MYTLIGLDGKPFQSTEKGTIGGYKRLKIYGRLDCPNANQMIAKGHYVKHRVFFADEATAIEAGYRPCGKCMKDRYDLWKQALTQASGDTKQARANYRLLVKRKIDLSAD